MDRDGVPSLRCDVPRLAVAPGIADRYVAYRRIEVIDFDDDVVVDARIAGRLLVDPCGLLHLRHGECGPGMAMCRLSSAHSEAGLVDLEWMRAGRSVLVDGVDFAPKGLP